MSIDLQKHSRTIALALLSQDDFNQKLSTNDELKWGKKGSLSVNIRKGTFINWETGISGGMVDLIREYHGADVSGFLNSLNLDQPIRPVIKTNGIMKQTNNTAESFTADQMRQITKECEYISFSHDASLLIARWRDKKIRPYHKKGDLWFLGRPEGDMPLFISEGSDRLPILVVEGEKAFEEVSKAKMYPGKIVTWHGGSNSYDKSDWSVIKQDRAFIYPDNDEAGYKAALGIKSILESHHKEVTVVKNPNTWNDKDDLADHLDWEINLYEYAMENPYVPEKPPVDPRRIRLIHAKDAMTNIKPPDWAIKGVLEKDSLTLLYGTAKAGKSFVSISMAASISLGIPWYDHKTNKGFVVYLAGEGQRGIGRRLLSWQKLHGYDLHKSGFHFSNRGAQLLNDDEAILLRDEILALQDHYGDKPAAIFIDTLARNFGAGNENSTEDMNRFVASIDRYLREEFGSAIVLVHHTGHEAATRARGSSVLPAAVDWSYQVTREDHEEHTMILDFEQTLIKDGKPMPPKRFQFQEVELIEMQDEDGLPTTSGALKEVNYVPKKKLKKLGVAQKPVKEAIDEIYNNKVSEARNTGKDISGIRVSYFELFKYSKENIFKGTNPSDSLKSALNGLINNEVIEGDEEIGYKPTDAQQF
tara:strand:- start:1663 stop:3597 length:1935 start_codon:yes stop_codon:yes gene_type:complete